MTDPTCPFCTLPPARILWADAHCFAFADAYPVTPGHTLIVPKRHVPTWFDASPAEKQALWSAFDHIKALLDAEHSPDGYNLGINAGEAAGQTVPHLHLHVIPRYHGDTPNPRGGVRGVIPAKQDYTAPTPASDPDDPFASLPPFVAGESDHLLTPLRRALQHADQVDIVAAFAQHSGVELLESDWVDALHRGARIRLLTSDYLNITSAHALQRLLTLHTAHEAFEARLHEVTGPSFHPKAYLFARDPHGIAYVGSSNLSGTALTHGIEWNLRATDATSFARLRDRFEHLFADATPLTPALVADYQQRVPVPPAPEPAAPKPVPHDIQVEVLQALRQTRQDGHEAGLVVMATGTGKTFLSAFDFAQLDGQRALFVAHRQEILDQAADTWRRVHPDRTIGRMVGADRTPDADLLFASVQTLSRAEHLRTFDPTHFDYVVIDEFHHAAASSYRKLLAHFTPRFLLGLTATPDRMDGAALLELCGDNPVARIGLVEGIQRGRLVPFAYHGVADTLDFATIPWRSGRFDAAELTARSNTRARADQALREYRKHAPDGRRCTLVFCCSVAHADYMAAFLSEHGVPCVAVHSQPSSAPRADSLRRLASGDLEAICAVDVFNEGVDIPDVNVIVMLRPTDSPIVFLQQLGRGLRPGRTLDKPALVVVDFIGNHRSFLTKTQALAALSGRSDATPQLSLKLIEDGLDLPEGCSVDIETEALDLLRSVAKLSRDDHLRYTYQELRDGHGRRPSAWEVFAAGTQVRRPIRQRYGTWFDFLDAMGDLADDERRVLDAHRSWFDDLLRTQMTRSYKMVALEALADLDALHTDIDVAELAARCRRRLRSDPVLVAELAESHDIDAAAFAARWRTHPLRVFHSAKGFSQRWFELDGDRFLSRLDVAPADRPAFDAMTAEMVDFRLRAHIAKRRFARDILPFTAPIELRVSHTRGNPILRFSRDRRPDLPEGQVPVHIEGRTYTLSFRKIAVNVATERPGGPNVLPQLMRRWFGPTAGQPGTHHAVELVRTGDAWGLRPRRLDVEAEVIPLGQVDYYAELAVACGVAAAQFEGHDVREQLAVQATVTLDPTRHFVVRASGDSMDGGSAPIADGDLVLCEWLTVGQPEAVEGQAVLLSGGQGDEVFAYLKRPVRVDGSWVLRSDNPATPDQPLDPAVTLRIVARVVEVVQPRQGPVRWQLYDRDAIAQLFGRRNGPDWRTGHKDIEDLDPPQTVLMVNLRKPPGTPLEHRYADRFLARDELQWESQASTTPQGAKGQRLLHQTRDGRAVHLFVRYHTKDAAGKGEPFVYCGTLTALGHEGSQPIRMRWRLGEPLPEGLWRAWAD